MPGCQGCGAPISLRAEGETVCGFCGAVNRPAPREVEVPVPVQVVHNVVKVVKAGDGPRELRCPHCKKRLVAAKVEDVELNGCTGCGGIWVDNGSAQAVVAKPRAIFEELAVRAAANARGRLVRAERVACPACDASCDPTSVHGIALDVCAEHGTWFDAAELSSLVAVLNGTRRVVRGHAVPKGDVPCAECGQTIRAETANIGERGPTCEACWRARQKELSAIAESQHDRRAASAMGVAAGGLLLGLAAAMVASSKDA